MITIYPTIYRTDEPHYITLEKALSRIQNGDQKATVDLIRQGQRELKSQLPAVLFSGKFRKRADADIIEHSGLIILDFDHINVPETKKVLAHDQYVRACWVSPSGDGLKVLIEITHPEHHREHFRAAVDYFDKQYALEVDHTGINLSRACYESYDPDIVIREKYERFGAFIAEKVVTQVPQTDAITDYQKLNLAARLIRSSHDGDKHSTLLKASILMGGFISAGRVEEEEAVRVLEREIQKKDIDSIDTARNTIRDGIERGKLAPISETVKAEEQIRREMLLDDGDMSFMSSNVEDMDWILKYKNGELEVGLTTGNPIIDRNFVFKREFTMISGHSSIGKTTFMLYLMVSASIHHDWKWVIYSSENNTASIKMKLLQFATGRKIEDMSMHEINAMMPWVYNHFVILNNDSILSYSEVLLYCEKIMRFKDIDGLLIDPYNSLRIDLGMDRNVGVHEYHYEAASEFLTFSQRTNVAVWVNAHSVTASQRNKGFDGLPVAPFAEDTEHGGKWVNRADCFITLHRKIHHNDVEKRRETEFHVRKVRNQETGGEPTPIDTPYIFRMSDNGCSFEMSGPFSRMFEPMTLSDVEKQMQIE